jgi:hypothetical protein
MGHGYRSISFPHITRTVRLRPYTIVWSITYAYIWSCYSSDLTEIKSYLNLSWVGRVRSTNSDKRWGGYVPEMMKSEEVSFHCKNWFSREMASNQAAFLSRARTLHSAASAAALYALITGSPSSVFSLFDSVRSLYPCQCVAKHHKLGNPTAKSPP